MELYLQFGYGMMEHCRELVSHWNGGTVILSPRDLAGDQLERLSSDVRDIPGGAVLLDPQFYLPHGNHDRLSSHDFWPNQYDTNVFWQGPELASLMRTLAELNDTLGCREFLLPGLLAPAVNADWLETQRAVLEAAASGSGLPLVPTIALTADVVRSEQQISDLLEEAEQWQQDYRPFAYYVVCEHPKGDYLVEDPSWLANVLDLAAGLRLLGSHVTLGYSNHQMLIAAVAKTDAIASGTWMNVRSFPPSKFTAAYEDEIARRAKWYYCPTALSEYKLPFLDIAARQNLLATMQPPSDLGSGYAASLFAGAQPTSVDFPERDAFRHYLDCLRSQVADAELATFDDTVQHHESALDNAEALLNTLHSSGVRGQKRDFMDIIDVNRAALSIFSSTRGLVLRRQWPSL